MRSRHTTIHFLIFTQLSCGWYYHSVKTSKHKTVTQDRYASIQLKAQLRQQLSYDGTYHMVPTWFLMWILSRFSDRLVEKLQEPKVFAHQKLKSICKKLWGSSFMQVKLQHIEYDQGEHASRSTFKFKTNLCQLVGLSQFSAGGQELWKEPNSVENQSLKTVSDLDILGYRLFSLPV